MAERRLADDRIARRAERDRASDTLPPMSTLRVLLPGPPAFDRADPWALYDAAERCERRGRDVPAAWPQAERREAVLAADLVRVIALALPPMAAPRVAAAAAFALEDQLATTGEAAAIAVGAQDAHGGVLATVATRAMVASVAAPQWKFARAVAEPALAPIGSAWTWCASGAGAGFVRRPDGSAFAVAAASQSSATPPSELAAALAQATRAGGAPPAVAVAFACDDAVLARWSQATGARFVRAAPWRWDEASGATFAAATDLLQRERAPAVASRRGSTLRLLRPALVVAAVAVTLHVGATLVQWLWLEYDAWRASRALVALAQEAVAGDATTPDAAARAIARRHADLRHRAGLTAPSDALPLLGRAAGALAALPPGALKSATFADGAWTLELGPLDDVARAALEGRLLDAGVSALQAKTAAGHRMRLAVAP
jgi:type II secretion system protein L